MRVDKKKNVSKISKELLKNPLQTERELAEKTWVSKTTAHNIIWELDQIWPKDPKVVLLTDKDFDMMIKIQDEKFKRLEKPENINHNDLDKWENTATRRYTLFRWDATDEKWWLKNIENVEIL